MQQKTEIDGNKKSFNDNLKELREKITHQDNILKYDVKDKIKELKTDLKQNSEHDAVVKHNLDNIQQSKDKVIEELKSKIEELKTSNEQLRTTIEELKSNMKTMENKILDQESISATLWEKMKEINEKIKSQS